MGNASHSAAGLLPLMRYRDVASAVAWLESAFGFRALSATADPDGTVVFAEMSYGDTVMLLYAIGNSGLDSLMRQPDELGGAETRTCYVVVEHLQEHYDRALAAGAAIVLDMQCDTAGRGAYSCRDPEGHIWSFGTYKPASVTDAERVTPARTFRGGLLAACLTGAVASGVAGWLIGTFRSNTAPPVSNTVSQNSPAPPSNGDVMVRQQLASELDKRAAAEALATKAADELAAERAAREGLELTVGDLRQQIDAERRATKAALSAADEAEKKNSNIATGTISPEKAADDAGRSQPSGGDGDAKTSDSVAATSVTTPKPGVLPDKAEQQRSSPSVEPKKRVRSSQPEKKPRPAAETKGYVKDAPWPYSVWSEKP